MTPHDTNDWHQVSDLKCGLKSSLVHPQVLGSASTSRNSDSRPEDWRKISYKLPRFTQTKTIVGTNLSPDLGPMGRGARPPTGPTPRPSNPGRRVSRGPSTCSEKESLVLYKAIKNLPQLIKRLIIGLVERPLRRWHRGGGILSKLLNEP